MGAAYSGYDIIVQRDTTLLERQIQQIAPEVKVTPLVARDTVVLTGEVDSLERSQLVVSLAKAFFSQADAVSSGGSSGNNSSGGGPSSSGASSGSLGALSGDSGGSSSGSGGLASSVPGSSMLGADASVINLIHVKGMPTTKLEMVRQKLTALHTGIKLDVVPGADGTEKAILTGRVPFTGLVAKAINLASVFYGQPGIKVINGPGGNGVREGTKDSSDEFQTPEAFSDNKDINLVQGSVVTDTSGNVVSLIEVENKPQIRASVKFLDVSRSALDQLGVGDCGFKWKPSRPFWKL